MSRIGTATFLTPVRHWHAGCSSPAGNNENGLTPMKTRHAAGVALAAITLASSIGSEAVAQVSNSAAYNSPYGMSQAATNQTVDPSLRDSNGNLTVVNGQFTSSNMSQGAQSMSSLGASGSGVGFDGPMSTDTASAIGNSLNV